MVPVQHLAALRRSARGDFLADRFGVAVVGADRLPWHKFQQMVEALDGLPPSLVRDGPIARVLLGADLGSETYGETIDTSVAIGLVTCRGIGNRRHVIPTLTLFQATIVHEIGHTVAFADDRALQSEFDRAFWPDGERDRARGSPLSPYGLLASVEDFAEAFLHYRHNGMRMLQVSPQRYAWMGDCVFDGREF